MPSKLTPLPWTVERRGQDSIDQPNHFVILGGHERDHASQLVVTAPLLIAATPDAVQESYANVLHITEACNKFEDLKASNAELLESLKGLLADIQDYQRRNNLAGENNHWQQRARTAIAKAEVRLDATAEPALPPAFTTAMCPGPGGKLAIFSNGEFYMAIPEGPAQKGWIEAALFALNFSRQITEKQNAIMAATPRRVG